ncbi:MAG: hypothetical protein ACYS9C_18420 [Planctomycetota bacterium]
MARFLPFDSAFGFAQGKLFRCAALAMTEVSVLCCGASSRASMLRYI